MTVDISFVRPEDRERSADLIQQVRSSLPELIATPGPGADAPSPAPVTARASPHAWR